MSERQLGVPPRALRAGGAIDKADFMPLSPYRAFFLEATA